VYIGTAEVQHCNGDRVSEREKRDTGTSGDSWDKEGFYEQEFLDKRVLCEYGCFE
jgi:hypothetical protein